MMTDSSAALVELLTETTVDNGLPAVGWTLVSACFTGGAVRRARLVWEGRVRGAADAVADVLAAAGGCFSALLFGCALTADWLLFLPVTADFAADRPLSGLPFTCAL